ncbi:hypothetical protein GE09DRAFT_1193211 [Coniochaeta sp. 2T2.1]|nr:hypothetical protein GE09DRAFT_1193211 [Coniochaeta sp. 2T2.1]
MAPGKGKKNLASTAVADGGSSPNTPKKTAQKAGPMYNEEPHKNYDKHMIKVTNDRMFIVKVVNSGYDGDVARHFSFVPVDGNDGGYTVAIEGGKKMSCTCPSVKFSGPTCKHILYALAHALKVDEPLRWQVTILKEHLEENFANMKMYTLTQAQVNADPSLTDGIPKSIDDDCPICYKPCSDDIDPVVCCTSCGHYAHNPCFDAPWSQKGIWGSAGVTQYQDTLAERLAAEKEALKEEKKAERAAAKAEKDAQKKAEKAAEKEAKAAEKEAEKAAKAVQKAQKKAAAKAVKATEKAAEKAAAKAEKNAGNATASPGPKTPNKRTATDGAAVLSKKRKLDDYAQR